MLHELGLAMRAELFATFAQLELTPMQAHLLRVIDPDRPMPMSDVADALSCDASNVTGLVDRLEARGLVERRPGTRDRRVKEIAITPDGRRARRAVMRAFTRPPAPLRELAPADRALLEDILRRALGRNER
jgi:DNA-binding MarR family transcriptional regulator